MLIPLNDLIIHFNEQLQLKPKFPHFDRLDVAESTLCYLNGYRQTQEMLSKLAAGKGVAPK